MNVKKETRIRRAKRARVKIRELGVLRLTVHKTPRHIYAQVISDIDSRVVACASTLDKELKKIIDRSSNTDAAKVVGKVLAERAVNKGVQKVAFDRSGFKFHGRIKALADSARESGLQF